MSEPATSYLTDPEIAARIRRTANDLAVERQRATAASEGLEAGLRELADELHADSLFETDETMGEPVLRPDQGRFL